MPKPRYDEEEDKSRHAAASPKHCKEMERKYGWKLVDIEKTGDSILKVDCVFKGKTEFPKSFQENETEEE
ncbi:hypothetical protein WA1_16760 [Scytonema hofmannii PCC 7110]|jgi:hypothetical protein|uniref:Uncharacterized protein n=2 Tax=Scytonema hofmannii TaxID=34078 RepID=A0A139XAH3_9CYAN|nr:hypothetical protein WA1_16760 [Scytonema hofmannii PCC 7110]